MFNKFLSLILIGSLCAPAFAADSAGGSYGSDEETTSASSAKLGNIFGSQDMGGDINYWAFDLSYPSRKNAGIRSALFPGWGQLFNGETRKGTLYVSVATVLLVSAFATYNDASNSYDDYLGSGRKDSDLYSDYSNKMTLTWVLAGAYAVLWGASFVDAVKRVDRTGAQGPVRVTLNERGEGGVVYKRAF